MRGTKFAAIDFGASRGATFACVCLAALAATAFPCQADDGLVDVSTVARPDGAKVDPDHASPMDLEYSVPGSVANTVAATKKLLAADGWKQYDPPTEDPDPTGFAVKKGSQGLLVSFTMTGGSATQS